MPSEYTPSGSTTAFTVPAYADVVDGVEAFRSFADDVAAADSVLLAAATNLQYIVQNPQVAGYTLALADAGRLVEMSGGGTLTVPTNSSAAFPIGTQIVVLQTGASQVTVAGAATVTVNSTPGLKLRTQWSLATLIKRGTNVWLLVGDTAA